MSPNEAQPGAADRDEFPTAAVHQRPGLDSYFSQSTALLWIVAAVCLVAAIVISVRALSPHGVPITVRFAEGYGLQPEDQVRFRGMVVGEVDSIELDESLESVNVHLRARRVACPTGGRKSVWLGTRRADYVSWDARRASCVGEPK